MREMLRLFLTIVAFSAVSGGLLAMVRSGTQEQIEFQQLVFVKGPAIQKIMEGAANNPVEDSFSLMDRDKRQKFFVGEFNGRRNAVALETFGSGFGGPIGVIAGINVETDRILGVGVTTHSETPGIGSQIQTSPSFLMRFKGMPISSAFQVKADGGGIDAISGATVSSRGVCAAMVEAAETYLRLKDRILEELKS